MLSWSFDQIEAFAVLVGSTSLNWQNPVVRQTLDKTIAIDADKVKENIEKQHSVILEFVKHGYQTIWT
jgi:hypothetical protein